MSYVSVGEAAAPPAIPPLHYGYDDMEPGPPEDPSQPLTIAMSELTNRRPWSHGHFGSVERATYEGREVCHYLF